MHSLAATDLNLLAPLHALLEERNVSAAARRVGLSQPAMSHALRRLRDHFEDPLLLRKGRGMLLTPRALVLLEQLRPLVRQLEQVLDPRAPTAAELALAWRLVTDDAIGCTRLPRLVAALAAEAPGVTLDITARGAPGRKELLRAGQVDLALGFFSGAGMDLHRLPLYDEPWVCVLREDHPALSGKPSGKLTPERYASLRHVIVSPTGGRRGEVDRLLQARGLAREVAVATPHFTAALTLVAATDMVLTTARSLAERFAGGLGLALVEPPLPMAPYTVSMMWHPRTEHDPAQRWLRDLVRRSV